VYNLNIMTWILGLFASPPFFIMPTYWLGWLGLVCMSVGLVWIGWSWYEGPGEMLRRRWWLFLLLAVLTPLTALTLALLPTWTVRPLPGVPLDAQSPALVLLSALPWLLAAGLLGPVPAGLLGLFSGLLSGLFNTHSPFTVLETAALALAFGAAVRQRYRTLFYRILRHPLGAAIVLSVVFIPVYMLSAFLGVNGGIAVRLDYALTQTWPLILARGVELCLGAIFAEILFVTRGRWWGRKGELIPSPAEVSLQTRFFYGTVPLVFVLFFVLTVGDWLVAGNAARRMVTERLASSARIATDSLPYFIETGQSLVMTMAAPELVDAPPEQRSDLLAQRVRSVPFFRQLIVFDLNGNVLGGYPENNPERLSLADEETAAVALASRGVAVQTYAVNAELGGTSAQIVFIALIPNAEGQPAGVLLGRTDLVSTPFTQPALRALDEIKDLRGGGKILDENQQVLFPLENQTIEKYGGDLPAKEGLVEDTSSTGTRQYTYYQPAVGRPWSVVVSVPAEVAQELALEIAVPLLVTLLVVSILAFVLLRFGLRAVTSTVRLLSAQAARISVGDLDRPVQVRGADEVARLAEAFEQMRTSLKARLDELNRLLVVSQGVAANLEIHGAVRPILAASLVENSSMSRVVLIHEVTLDLRQDMPVSIGAGPSADLFAYLDGQIFELMRQQDLLTIPNVGRMRRLNIPNGRPYPGALLAIAIKHESRYFGAFWIAYDQPHNFSEEEIRFLSTLCGEIALAAASARLYATAEVGRQRLEGVLASTPEPVLVIDEQNRLLLLNPAALQAPGLVVNASEGKPIQDAIALPELVAQIIGPMDGRISSREITLPNGRIYYSSVAPVAVEGRPVGRICLLRDITHFKELDQLKSDFVATVSHDLRSPLTLVRGYATMLQMVGELNEQQKGYTKKILGGIENMSRLVSNLLDLGRIEAGIGLQIERVVVAQVMDEVVNSLQLQATQKEIALSVEVPGETAGLVIEADRALLQQALYNLVENAIKYTSVNGQVRLRLEPRPATVLYQVIDNGIGIAPIDLPRLFEKFYRSGRREAYQQRGSGLGLAIVKSIAERHTGRVWVDSTLGKGSVFSLELPIRQAETVLGKV
jgi:signal transduction histidine kinase/HAMP domain-containing protein